MGLCACKIKGHCFFFAHPCAGEAWLLGNLSSSLAPGPLCRFLPLCVILPGAAKKCSYTPLHPNSKTERKYSRTRLHATAQDLQFPDKETPQERGLHKRPILPDELAMQSVSSTNLLRVVVIDLSFVEAWRPHVVPVLWSSGLTKQILKPSVLPSAPRRGSV